MGGVTYDDRITSMSTYLVPLGRAILFTQHGAYGASEEFLLSCDLLLTYLLAPTRIPLKVQISSSQLLLFCLRNSIRKTLCKDAVYAILDSSHPVAAKPQVSPEPPTDDPIQSTHPFEPRCARNSRSHAAFSALRSWSSHAHPVSHILPP